LDESLIYYGAGCSVDQSGGRIIYTFDENFDNAYASTRDQWLGQYNAFTGRTINYEYDISYVLTSTEPPNGHDSSGIFKADADIIGGDSMWDETWFVAAAGSSSGNFSGSGTGVAGVWSRIGWYNYSPWATHSFTGSLTFYQDGCNPVEVPTPTPTPLPDGLFCGAVSDGSSDVGNTGFEIGNVVSQVCVTLPEFTLTPFFETIDGKREEEERATPEGE